MSTHPARLRRCPELRVVLAAAVALLAWCVVLTGTARASEIIPAVGVNDLRSDGILLSFADYSGTGDLDLMSGAGTRLYRARVRLDCVDPGHTATFDFSGSTNPACSGVSYDDLVGDLAARGMTLLPVLMNFGDVGGGYVPIPPTADGAGASPTRAEFAAFAAAAARRYGPDGSFWDGCGCVPQPVRAWEIWNEANNGWWWGGHADPADYAAMFAQTRPALRAADPDARAVVGGLVWDPNGQPSFVAPERMIATLTESNANAFDAVAIHPYTDARGQSGAQLAAAAQAYVHQAAQAVAWATGARPDGRPRQQIWVTEMGWSDSDADPQAIADGLQGFLGGLDAGARAADNVGPVLWYMLRDNADRVGRDDQLGMRYTTPTGADGGAKPVWGTFAAAASRHALVTLPDALPDAGPADRIPYDQQFAAPVALPAPAPAPVPPSRRTAPKHASDARVVTVTASAAQGAVSLRVTCVDAKTSCSAAVRLRALLPPAGKKGSAARTRTATVGSRSLRVAGGRTKIVKVKLSRTGAAALKRTGRLRVSAVVTARDLAGRKVTRQASTTLRPSARRSR